MINYFLFNLKKTILNKYYWRSIFIILDRDYKAEYGASVFGNLWMIIRPFILISVYAVVFSKITRFPTISNYPFFLTTNIVLWMLISSVITIAPGSILTREDIIKVCPFSKTSFVVIDIIKQVKIYFISLSIIYVLIGLVFRVDISLTTLLFPFYFIILFFILMNIAVGLAYIYPYFRDIKTLIDSCMPALMWLTPIVYPAEAIGGRVGLILKFSPFTIMMNPFTKILYYGELPSLFDNIAFISLLLISTILVLYIHKKLARDVVYYL